LNAYEESKGRRSTNCLTEDQHKKIQTEY
jgi:hypothetical protein